MSGRPAPPGRKGSVKINAFKADEDVSAPVAVATLTAAERQKHERDEEMKKLMALRKQAQTQEAEVLETKKEGDSKKIVSPLKPVADAAERDRKRLEEVRARNAKLEEDESTSTEDAERVAAAKKAAEDAERAAAAKKAAEDAERAAAAKKAAEDAESAAAAKKAAEDAERAAVAKKVAEDAESAAAAKKAAEDAERAAAAKKSAEDAERAAAAKKAAEDAERAAAAKKAAEDAERAAAAKKAAEDAERAAAAKKAAEDEEKARIEEERKAQEQARLAAVAAKEEALRAEKAEKLRLAQLEQQKREQEEAEAEELAFQQEQEQQRLQLEEQRKKREEAEAKRQLEQQESLRQQAELEEQQRRMDEKLARQKEALAEAAANEKREQELQQQRLQAEAQERERARQEELAARKAAEQAEIARLREEEAARQQALLETQRREEEEHAAEVLRLEQDRLAAAEEARKAEEAISQYENAALEEKKRRAEAQRKKREAFLSEMDSFSTTFEAKTQVEDEAIKAEQDKHYELLAQQMKQVEEAKAATMAKEAQEKEQREAQRVAAAELAAAELARANVPPPVPTVLPVQPVAPVEEAYSIKLNATEEPKKDLLSDLTSSLFKPAVVPVPFPTPVVAAVAPVAEQSAQKEEVPRPDSISPAMEPIEEEVEGEEETEPTAAAFGTEELRVPTRIGNGKAKAKPVVLKPVAVSIINARTAAATVKYSEDEEEEGTGEAGSISNVLTLEERRKLTLAQKDTWRAKQADLTEKRKEFHGVVTYTFDGVFAWQMYGSAEAVDESGAAYTEYLMRCQWGTTFDNMQPWIVAHRYKEFDKLDQQLKAKFPRLEPNMPKLPKKELFRSLQADVVAERRAVLEEYMSKIVNSMPSLLRSDLMNDFLDITNRISGIRLMLLKASNAIVEARHTPPPTPTPSRPVSVTPQQRAAGSGVSSNSKYGIEDPLAFRAQQVDPLGALLGDVEEETLLWTVDEAESARAAKNSHSLDEDQLGHLETDIRLLGQLLRKTEGKALVAKDSKFRAKFNSVSKNWPSLRATAVVGMGVDFTLIPRAMQAEEDLVRILNEFRNIDSLVTASNSSSMRSAMV